MKARNSTGRGVRKAGVPAEGNGRTCPDITPEMATTAAVAGWDRQCERRTGARMLAERVRAEVGRRRGRCVWMPAFLAVLARTANVRLACFAAGVTRQHVYGVRSREASFREAWDAALDMAIDRLEEEAWARACEGVERYVISYGKPVLDETGKPLVERHYSDMLLERLLRAYRPQKYRETPVAGDVQTVVKVYGGFDPDQM
ncbi:MAG TPA: hypothetical protein VHI13_18620 [Candidatus Kapabacteria bacterium]|nr:hypothetical protein [Candidatus Kapabacteria bacterium]